MQDIIIPVMNKSSFPELCRHYRELTKYFHQLIVVDFDIACEYSKCGRRLLTQTHHKYIAVTNGQTFNKSAALNIGFGCSASPFVLFCDADVLITKETLEEFQIQAERNTALSLGYVIEEKDGSVRHAPGIILCHRDDFGDINGFDSGMVGWGAEDLDFQNRLKNTNVSLKQVGFGVHITHDEEERVRNYDGKNRTLTRNKNFDRMMEKLQKSELDGTLDKDITSYTYEILNL